MNNSETPTGVNGKKDLEFKRNKYKGLNVKDDVSKEDLATKWEDFMKEAGYDYHSLQFEYMSFEVPNEVIKDRVGDENEPIAPLSDVFENVDSNSIKVIRLDTFTRATGLPEKTEKNAKAYDKARANAKEQSESRRDEANKKVDQEKNSVSRDER